MPATTVALGVAIAVLAGAMPAAQVAASSALPAVHELRTDARAEGAPLRVSGRAPLPRFRSAPSAGASSVRVANASATETRTNGKILAVSPGFGPYSCSGTAVDTPSRSIVLTAGHCAIEARRVGRRIAFVPAYDHGKRPFGTFRVRSVYVMRQWRRGENPAFDLAALRVAPTRRGRLVDVVGGRGYVTSRSRLFPFEIFGYPAAALRGEELRSCRAHGLGADPLTNPFAGPPTLPASCDMAAGASGGGWLYKGMYLNGVTSYSYAGRPTRLHSPYFGPQVASFLRQLP